MNKSGGLAGEHADNESTAAAVLRPLRLGDVDGVVQQRGLAAHLRDAAGPRA